MSQPSDFSINKFPESSFQTLLNCKIVSVQVQKQICYVWLVLVRSHFSVVILFDRHFSSVFVVRMWKALGDWKRICWLIHVCLSTIIHSTAFADNLCTDVIAEIIGIGNKNQKISEQKINIYLIYVNFPLVPVSGRQFMSFFVFMLGLCYLRCQMIPAKHNNLKPMKGGY